MADQRGISPAQDRRPSSIDGEASGHLGPAGTGSGTRVYTRTLGTLLSTRRELLQVVQDQEDRESERAGRRHIDKHNGMRRTPMTETGQFRRLGSTFPGWKRSCRNESIELMRQRERKEKRSRG